MPPYFPSYVPAPAARPLLLLDYNKLILWKEGKDVDGKYTYGFVPRPHVQEFFKEIKQFCDVAIFSSTVFKNIREGLAAIHLEEANFKFIWARDRCELPRHLHLLTGNNARLATVKHLKRIWNAPYINGESRYSHFNTLICDDEICKVDVNPVDNYLIIKPFMGDLTDTYLLELIGLIREKFAKLREKKEKFLALSERLFTGYLSEYKEGCSEEELQKMLSEIESAGEADQKAFEGLMEEITGYYPDLKKEEMSERIRIMFGSWHFFSQESS